MTLLLLTLAALGIAACAAAGGRWWIVAGWFLLSLPFLAEAAIPAQAKQYERALTREAQRTWGLNAPTARFAGQIAVESGWNATAKSRYAAGLAQFTPDTAKWIAQVYPAEFDGLAAPYSPGWALRALVVYDKHLYDRVRGHDECDRWHFTLRAYNGGLGHIQAESKHAADPLSFTSVATACGTARRSVKHCRENLGYPQRIMYRWEPEYRQAGWYAQPVCAGEQAMLRRVLGEVNALARYQREPGDHWQTPVELRRAGAGDCEDFAVAYCAALRGMTPRLACLVGQGEPHMVCIAGGWVLDVLADEPYPASALHADVAYTLGEHAGEPATWVGDARRAQPFVKWADLWRRMYYAR